MIQGGGGPRLVLKTAQVVGIVAGGGPDQLQCDIAPQPFIAGAENFSHPSGANLFEDPIVPDQLTDHTRNAVFLCMGMLGLREA